MINGLPRQLVGLYQRISRTRHSTLVTEGPNQRLVDQRRAGSRRSEKEYGGQRAIDEALGRPGAGRIEAVEGPLDRERRLPEEFTHRSDDDSREPWSEAVEDRLGQRVQEPRRELDGRRFVTPPARSSPTSRVVHPALAVPILFVCLEGVRPQGSMDDG